MKQRLTRFTSRLSMTKSRRDVLIIAVSIALTMLLADRSGVFDWFLDYTRRRSDHLIAHILELTFFLAPGFAILALRRWQDLARENSVRAEAECHYRTLFERANDAILIFTREDETILAANAAAHDLYGVAQGELIGRSLFEFSANVARGKAAVADLFTLPSEQTPESLEFRQRRSDGSPMDVLARASVIDYQGQPAVLAINRDITARKRAEQRLIRQNAYFAALHETTVYLLQQRDPVHTLEAILNRAAALLDTTHGYIDLVRPGKETLDATIGIGRYGDLSGYDMHPGEGIGGTVWHTGRPVVVQNYETWQGRVAGFDGFHAIVGVPLTASTGVAGVLGLARTEPEHPFTDEEVEMLVRFAELASIALENARLYEQTRSSETRKGAILEAALDCIISIDVRGAIIQINPAAERAFGYSRADVIGRPFADLVDPSAFQASQDFASVILDQRIEATAISADGLPFPIDLAITRVPVDDPPMFTAFLRDLTERKRAEAAVTATERRFQAMVERSADGIVLFDKEYRRSYVSPSTTNILGYTPEEYRGLRRTEIFHPDDIDRIAALMQSLAAVPGETKVAEARVRHKDGSWRWLAMTYTNLLAEPDVRAIVTNYHDITERKNAETALLRQHAYLEALHETSLGLLNRLDPTDVLHAIIQRAGELIGTPHGFIDLVSEDRTRLDFIIGHGVFDLVGVKPSSQGEGLGGIVWETGQPLLVEDYASWSQRRDGPHMDLFRTATAVPLFNGQEVIGVLGMARTEPGQTFDEAEIESLGRFAQLAAIALDNARLHAQVRDELRERERAEVQLRESENRYRLMFDSNPLPMWVYDALTLRFLAVNDAAVAHYGYTRDAFLAMTMKDLRLPEDIPLLNTLLADPDSPGQTLITRHRKHDGTVIDVEIIAHDIPSDQGRTWLVLANDVTERKMAEEALRHNALHDALTGLPNRTLFAERLTRALDRAKRDAAYRFAVLYLDFDRFKTINDSLGHLEGDRVLIEGARRLAKCVRPQDTLARLGGDEFVILLEELSDADDPIAIASRLECALAAPIALRSQDVVIAASIGIVLGALHYHRPDEVIRDADIAMYQAKATGNGKPIIFDATMHARVVARMFLENDLRRAVEDGEFVACYQPIVSLASGEAIGVEMLIRWHHPDMGEIAPADFIPLAEETGLIVPIGRWALREACHQLRAWDDRSPEHQYLTISVNVSARELLQSDFVSEVQRVLHDTGLTPDRLALEMTESALVDEIEAVTATLRALADIGVRIHLDDFGMGYSSLSYLHRFPIDVLKIDRSFVSAPGQPELANQGIVEAIVALAHTLHISVTAEGIETAEQRMELTILECEYGQGYHFSPPLRSDEAAFWLARQEQRAPLGWRRASEPLAMTETVHRDPV